MKTNYIRKILGDRQDILVLLLLLVICVATYSNCLNNGFLLDDNPMLIAKKNLQVKDLLQLNPQKQSNQIYFRPVFHLILLITSSFFGKNPIGYNISSIFIHYLTCISVYYLIFLITKNFKLSLITSLLYCIHPINGILINHKICLAYSVLVFSINASLINYIHYLEDGNNKSKLFLSIIWFIIALLCHEMAIVLPFYLLSFLFILKKYNFLDTLKKSWIILLVSFLYLTFRMYYSSLRTNVIDNISVFGMSFFQYIASYVQLIIWYISKLIWPYGIVLSWETVSPMEVVPLLCFLLLFLIILLSYVIVRYWKKSLKSFAIIWFLIGLGMLGITCFSRPALGFTIQPHWLSSSSIGIFLFFSIFLLDLKKYFNNKLWIIIISFIIVFYISFSRYYNSLWNNQKKYCKYWLGLEHHSFWPNFWVGYSYLNEKNFKKAKYHFLISSHKAVRVAEHNKAVLGNLGIIEYNLKNYNSSLYYLKKALEIEPNLADIYYYIGLNYLEMNDIKNAEKNFRESINLDKYFIAPKRELERLLPKQKEKGSYISN